jgi:hypothetical protein
VLPAPHTLSGSCSELLSSSHHAAQLCADRSVRWPYVTLTEPPCPSIRHRLRDLITHPSSQHAFVADLAAGGISPHEISLCTTRVRVRRQYTWLSNAQQAIRAAAHAVSCSPAEITHAQLCADSTVRWPYVSLTAPPGPSIRHRLHDLITHPSSQHAFVADLAAGCVSPPEFSRYTARARVQGSTRCSVLADKPYAQWLTQ